jgi:hypothetical protein
MGIGGGTSARWWNCEPTQLGLLRKLPLGHSKGRGASQGPSLDLCILEAVVVTVNRGFVYLQACCKKQTALRGKIALAKGA